MKLYQWNKKLPKQIGQTMENLACAYLKKAGLRLLLQNYHCKMGEIDLIMQDNHYLVFVEVRYRSHINYGSSLESVDRKKQMKLIKTAEYYLLTHRNLFEHMRFDIVAIDKIHNAYQVQWLKNAIEL